MAFPAATFDPTKAIKSRQCIIQVTIATVATVLLVDYVGFDGASDLGRMMAPGASNGAAFTAAIWEKSRSEILKVKCREVKKIPALLGGLTGKKDGTCTAYIRDVDDIS